jgi:hypothetical protein
MQHSGGDRGCTEHASHQSHSHLTLSEAECIACAWHGKSPELYAAYARCHHSRLGVAVGGVTQSVVHNVRLPL